MSAKEFFTAIDMLETYNRIMKISEPAPAVAGSKLDTRELGRYRSYVYREKLLRREILELAQSRMRIEKLIKSGDREIEPAAKSFYRRGRSKMINLFLELSQISLKRRELEQKLERIESPFVRKVVLHRYFTDETQRLHTWAQTAQELELPMTGVELRRTITNALQIGN